MKRSPEASKQSKFEVKVQIIRIDAENTTALLAIADNARNNCQDNPSVGGQTGMTATVRFYREFGNIMSNIINSAAEKQAMQATVCR